MKLKLLKNKYANDTELKNKLVHNILHELSTLNQKEIEELYNYLNHLYYNAETLIEDALFDVIKEYIEDKYPRSKVLSNVGAIPSSGKVKLPYFMASMKKLKPDDNSIGNWFKKYNGPFTISDKLDGTSGMIYFKDGKINMYTRGNHEYGRDISHLVPYLMPNLKYSAVEKIVKKELNIDDINGFALRGEIILDKSTFDKYVKEGFSSGSRSIVNALVIQKTINKKLAKDSHFVIFEVVHPRIEKFDQFKLVDKLKLETPYYEKVDKLNVAFLSKVLDKRRKESKYDIDGIIVEDNNVNKLVSRNTPDYAFAYKQVFDENIFEVPVLNVEYNASKDGVLIPIVHYQPINYNGDILKKATGFNAKFIKDNGIGVGAVIKVIRAGEIIPYIKEVVKSVAPSMPTVEYEFNESGVDAILKNMKENKDVQLKLLVNFFTKLEFPQINKGVLDKLVNNGLDTIDKILSVREEQLASFDGFQTKKASNIVSSIEETLKKINRTDIMAGSNAFGKGFGKRKINMILDVYPDIVSCYEKMSNNDKLVDDINQIDGFQEKTSRKFVENVGEFCAFLDDNPIIKNIYYKLESSQKDRKIKKQKSNFKYPKLVDIVVVMTGFRDKELKEIIEEHNGKIVDTISSKVNVLLTNDKTKESSKTKKAKSLDIPVMELSDFTDKYKG